MLLLFLYLLSIIFIFFILLLTLLYLTAENYPNLKRVGLERSFVDPKRPGKSYPFPDLLRDNASLELTIVVPAYNEEKRLSIMLDEAIEYLEERTRQSGLTWEIIVVDDGSSDGTTSVALRYSNQCGTERVRVLTAERNRGKGGAVRIGMLSGRGRYLLFADADGATKFSEVARLEQCLDQLAPRSDSCAIVCGSRAHLQAEVKVRRSFFRNILMHGFHWAVWLLCVKNVKDTQCGFKLLSRPAARLLFSNLHVERWAFDCDLLYLAQRFSVPVGEVPVSWKEIAGSKLVPVFSWIQMAMDLVIIRLRYTIGAWKLNGSLLSLRDD